MARARKRTDRGNTPRVEFLQMDAARLAFPDRSFDAVYVPYTINACPTRWPEAASSCACAASAGAS